MATTASAILYEYPVAKQIALGIGILVSNPGGMKEAAGQWQAPSTGDGETDFAGIKETLATIKSKVEDLWHGPAEEAFSQAVDSLIDQMAVAEQHFKGVGGSMDFVAQLYHYAAEVAMAVATVLMAVAAIWLAIKLQPFKFAYVLYVAIHETITPLAVVVRGLGVKLGKTLMVTTGIVAMANFMCASMTGTLTQNRPKPDYTPTGVEYTPPEEEDGVGTLEPTNGGMPSMPNMGGGGMMGGII
ncbi:hypothetical protein [Nonomuraea sp. KM88]|uniref:hypothetical protein n=1 Tax=Nonomuraea sp. KM88 TaxID=3457427 RepID=UPI003FCE325F